MRNQIFINLPVKDLAASFDFYAKMGFTNNPNFSDDSAKCMVFSEEIFVMLLTHDRFKTFVHKPIADLTNAVSCLLSLSVDSVATMDTLMENAVAAGGKEPIEAKDHGFMQQRTLEDLDGHVWEIFYMDITKLPQA
jgi:uncharacterized protein